MLKLRETQFFQEFTAVVAGCVLLVASAAFVSIPAALAHSSGEPSLAATRAIAFHLT